MENTFAKMEELAGNVKEYLQTHLEAAKLKTAEKSSLLLSNLLAGMAVLVVFLFFIVFAGLALAFALGALTGKVWLGFLLVALLFFLLGAGVWWGREKLIRLPLMNAFIKQLFNSKEDAD